MHRADAGPPSGRRRPAARRAPARRSTRHPRRAAVAWPRSARSMSAIEHGGSAVLERVVELVGRPPRVERHGDGADRGDGRERDHPLGVVPHADGHAVTRRDPVAVDEEGGEGVDVGHHLGEAPPLVLVHEEGVVAACAGAGEDLAEARWRVLERLHRHAPHLDRLDLEPLARSGDGGGSFLVRQHGALASSPAASGAPPRTVQA